ncbi:testicular haploid expressed gene protein-like isoform X2 [Electrophorus electricus]|uniref:testicular haploid expressed gene protein-like isoform X2 n=1 Tax=Electrophorus electricus TaxID=8005 RepID=UPI0015CF98C4|nr:testicular haploid expressed gene protein-like isoform X2 [Electrophorus electricus]
MVSLKTKFNSNPSNRILQLAQHKESKSMWVTTPGRKLTWGNQEPIWPVTLAALEAVPTPRLQALAQHKKDFFAFHQEQLCREEEEDRRVRKSHPLSCVAQYEHVVRLATPRSRSRSFQEVSPPHSEWCEYSCPVWHISFSALNAVISPRLLQLAQPKSTHPNFRSNRQTIETNVTYAAKKAQPSPRLEQLCLPKLRESSLFYQHGPPESPIRPVSAHMCMYQRKQGRPLLVLV